MLYLNSFRPLCEKKLGRLAIKKYGLPPFTDSSCRREPDFQSHFPSISSICRGEKFAPRLHEGDSVVYITVKGTWKPEQFSHWRLVAILKIMKRFETHTDAATWFHGKGLPLPSNCLVDGNECLPYDMTGGTEPARFGIIRDSNTLLRKWDLSYKSRVTKCGVFLACEAEFLNLNNPPVLTDTLMLQIFGRFPSTQNPPPIAEHQFADLLMVALKA